MPKKVDVPACEFWDDNKQEFVNTKATSFVIEHSLVSISKWESKWKVPFLSNDPNTKFTQEQILDYIVDMTITQNVDPMVYYALTPKTVQEIFDYVQEQRTATWFGKTPIPAGSRDNRAMTSERLYHLMINYNIPMKCEKWHLSRLLTLIRICQEEQKKQEKKNPKDAAMARHNLNAARKARARHH